MPLFATLAAGLSVFLAANPAHAQNRFTVSATPSVQFSGGAIPNPLVSATKTQVTTTPGYTTTSNGSGAISVTWNVVVAENIAATPYDVIVTSNVTAMDSDTPFAPIPSVHSGFAGDLETFSSPAPVFKIASVSNTKNVGLVGAAVNPFKFQVTQTAYSNGQSGQYQCSLNISFVLDDTPW